MILALLLAIAFPILPDANLTPGDVLTTDAKVVCVPGYTKTVRNVSAATRRAVFARYGIPYQPGFELDHLRPLEVGGSNSVLNLWPQTGQGTWNYHVKDRLENHVHRLLCSGKITIQQAQAYFDNWIDSYQILLGKP